MNEIMKVTESNGKQLIDARELHQFLEVNSKFADWIKNRIVKYEFIEGEDFVCISKSLEKPQGGRPSDEYALTIEMAKELAMVENNAKGSMARKYFIEVEQKYKAIPMQLNTPELLLKAVQMLVETTNRQNEIESRVEKLETKTIGSGELQHFSILAFCNNIHKQISLNEAKEFGQKCSRMCTQMGFQTGKIPDPRFGTVKTYPLSVLESIIK